MSAREDLRALQHRWDAEGAAAPAPHPLTTLGFPDLIGIVLTGCVLVLIPFALVTVEAFL